MAKFYTGVLLLLIGLFQLSCASSRLKIGEVFETFDTKVFENGTKQFEYKIVSRQKNKKKSRGGGMSVSISGRGPNDGQDNMGSQSEEPEPRAEEIGDRKEREEKLLAILDQKLELKLKSTGFCREGFLTLEKEAIRGVAYIKGECRELATEMDRKLFPSAPKYQIIEEDLSL